MSVETWVYSDGLSQDRLTNDVIDVVSAITHRTPPVASSRSRRSPSDAE